MMDYFEDKEYEIVEPKPGDIVRINLHRDWHPGTRRMHFILVWPTIEGFRKHDIGEGFTIYCYSIDLGGHYGFHGLCYIPPKDKVVKPSMGDIFEFVDSLRINGYVYDRKSKMIIKKE